MQKTVLTLVGLAANVALAAPLHAQPLTTQVASSQACTNDSAIIATDQVLVSAERRETRTIPAQFRMVERQEVASPARINKYRVPAEIGYVNDVEVVRPQEVVRRYVPNNNETLNADGISYDPTPVYRAMGVTQAGMAMYYYPSSTTVIGYTVEEVVPAVVRNVQRQVILKPERMVEETILATYRTVQVREQVAPARTEVVHIPAVYETRQLRRNVSCETVVGPQTTAVGQSVVPVETGSVASPQVVTNAIAQPVVLAGD
jgi:hypothetical protein